MYLIALLGIIIAIAGIWFMAANSGRDRYQRKQLKKLYKRSRVKTVNLRAVKEINLN